MGQFCPDPATARGVRCRRRQTQTKFSNKILLNTQRDSSSNPVSRCRGEQHLKHLKFYYKKRTNIFLSFPVRFSLSHSEALVSFERPLTRRAIYMSPKLVCRYQGCCHSANDNSKCHQNAIHRVGECVPKSARAIDWSDMLEQCAPSPSALNVPQEQFNNFSNKKKSAKEIKTTQNKNCEDKKDNCFFVAAIARTLCISPLKADRLLAHEWLKTKASKKNENPVKSTSVFRFGEENSSVSALFWFRRCVSCSTTREICRICVGLHGLWPFTRTHKNINRNETLLKQKSLFQLIVYTFTSWSHSNGAVTVPGQKLIQYFKLTHKAERMT